MLSLQLSFLLQAELIEPIRLYSGDLMRTSLVPRASPSPENGSDFARKGSDFARNGSGTPVVIYVGSHNTTQIPIRQRWL